MLVFIDDSGRVVEWGRPAEELFGWSAEEAVGRSVTTLMSEAAADGERQRERFSERPRCWSSRCCEVLP
ncbi:PAS domain S-box protein [Streptomyces sp. NPDC005480]|uniref:PAS domain S-box protein n=1 Tax=Streptomyces sp. NPDC005480 TaxID=3154880 RepID=UPI0033B7D439